MVNIFVITDLRHILTQIIARTIASNVIIPVEITCNIAFVHQNNHFPFLLSTMTMLGSSAYFIDLGQNEIRILKHSSLTEFLESPVNADFLYRLVSSLIPAVSMTLSAIANDSFPLTLIIDIAPVPGIVAGAQMVPPVN